MTTKRNAPRNRDSAFPKVGCVQHDCAACKRVGKKMERLQAVVALAGELCDAIDRAEEDIGGSRPVKDILADLGPAVDRAEQRRS